MEKTVETKTTTKVEPSVEVESPAEKYESKKVIFRFYQVVWYILGVIEVFIFFRIILKAFGANPLSWFTYFIYTVSDVFVGPFVGMFRNVVEGESVFELAAFIGGFVYVVLAYGIVELMQIIKPTSPREVEENV